MIICAIAGAVLTGGARPAAVDERGAIEPEVERASDAWVIVRWTTPKAKGTSLRYGVVRYGTTPEALSETAKSPNRANPASSSMIFRVQINHLQPQTTYYYRAESTNAFGVAEGPESELRQFMTEPSPQGFSESK